MANFIDSLAESCNYTTTENGALTYKSTLSACLDLFALGGARRHVPSTAVPLFKAAFEEDRQLALRILFYLRDVRGGQGERAVFRHCLHWLHANHRTVAQSVFKHVPEYGRWDDLIEFSPVSMSDVHVVSMIRQQLDEDMKSVDGVSLLAKWLPSPKTGSKSAQSKSRATAVRIALGFKTEKEYRKTLRTLRERIHLLEQDMSQSKWGDIDYGKLPSRAHFAHTKAFKRHDEARYLSFVEGKSGKMNMSAVYPHEIAARCNEAEADALWWSLPDYTQGKDALVMADVSGSMGCAVGGTRNITAMHVSTALAVYFAGRNTGAFAGYGMTFSDDPGLYRIDPKKTLASQLETVLRSTRWMGGTNLSKAFEAIRIAAVESGGETPSVLYVISDMEFDQATSAGGYCDSGRSRTGLDTVFRAAKKSFEESGLTLPHVVFWNVMSRSDQAPALAHDGFVTLVSGLSPSVFKMAVEGKTPLELMMDVVNADRYTEITC